MKTKTAQEMIKHFSELSQHPATRSMVREAKAQYIDMARGGIGEQTGSGKDDNIRNKYYSSCNDNFFQTVCDAMGWEWR